MTLRRRLDRLKDALDTRSPACLFNVVVLCPVEEAEGRPLGLHHDGPPGSTTGVFVYDPAAGEPEVPRERLSSWGLVIGGDARPFGHPITPVETV